MVEKTKQNTYLDLSGYPNLKLKPDKEKAGQVEKTELQALFTKYGSEYGVDEQLLEKIAHCESGFNPQAVNGPYGGMYQFLVSTWISNRKAMGLDPDPSLRFDAEEAIKTTAYKISKDGTNAWPVCGR